MAASDGVPSELEELLARFMSGDQAAARTLFEDYRKPLLTVIRRKYLPPGAGMHRLVDSVDLLQEAWAAVVQSIHKGKSFTIRDEFERFLYALVGNRFRDCYRHHVSTAKRALDQTEGLDHVKPEPEAAGLEPWMQVASKDELQHFLDSLPVVEQRLVEAMLAGVTVSQLAQRFKVSPRSIQRLLGPARRVWNNRGG